MQLSPLQDDVVEEVGFQGVVKGPGVILHVRLQEQGQYPHWQGSQAVSCLANAIECA